MNGLALQGWCINTCKDKANEIMAAAEAIHADAILRVVSLSPDVHSEDGKLREFVYSLCYLYQQLLQHDALSRGVCN